MKLIGDTREGGTARASFKVPVQEHKTDQSQNDLRPSRSVVLSVDALALARVDRSVDQSTTPTLSLDFDWTLYFPQIITLEP